MISRLETKDFGTSISAWSGRNRVVRGNGRTNTSLNGQKAKRFCPCRNGFRRTGGIYASCQSRRRDTARSNQTPGTTVWPWLTLNDAAGWHQGRHRLPHRRPRAIWWGGMSVVPNTDEGVPPQSFARGALGLSGRWNCLGRPGDPEISRASFRGRGGLFGTARTTA